MKLSGGKKARHGEKMIEVKVRFWTDDIAADKNTVIPKHAWSSGVVRVEPNVAHEIGTSKPIPFNSLLELPAAIEKVLIKEGIVLHRSRKTKRYVSGE